MSTQTGSISFESTKGLQSYAKQNYATLSQIKGQFATCSTGASTAAKVATIVPENADWTLYNGATVTVKFTSKNTTTAPTLNINNTGAKPIKDFNGNDLTKAAYEWPEGAAMALTYDGTYWRIQDSSLMERVHTAETSIEQTATSITSLATLEDTYIKPDGTTETNSIKSQFKQTADSIDAKVDKNGVIASINASVEEENGSQIKISADKVNIEGAAIFSSGGAYDKSTTVVSTQTQWYSSTSTGSKVGGSWRTTQPTISAGRYIWQRELVTYADGHTEYKPSEAGVCIQGQTDLSDYSTTDQMNSAINASLEMYDYTIDLSSSTYDTATWYPVIITPDISGNYTHLTMNFNGKGGTPSWSSHSTKHWSASVDITYYPSQWGWKPDLSSYIDAYDFGQLETGLYPVTFSNELNHTDVLVMYARGGGIYPIRVNTTKEPVIKTSDYTSGSQTVSPTTTQPTNTSNFVKSRRATQTDITSTTNIANNAAPKTSAVSRTQRIYYRTNTALSNSITGPTTWIGESGNKYNTTAPTTAITGWSTKPTPLAASTEANAAKYLYLYTCTQTQTVAQVANGGTQCSASTVLLDDTETIIDGGKIITGSIDANSINANAITADKIAANAVTAGKVAAGAITADKIATNAITIGMVNGLDTYVTGNLLGNTLNSAWNNVNISDKNNTYGFVVPYNTASATRTIESYDTESNSVVLSNDTATGNRGVGWFTKAGAVKAGVKYTFSCLVWASVAVSVHTHTAWRSSAESAYGGWTSAGSKNISANTWTQYSYTFQPDSSANLTWEFLAAICYTGQSGGVTFRVAHAKLEEGDEATSWYAHETAVDAKKTATNYITADTAGIKIHNISDTTNYIHQTSSGTKIYKDSTLKADYADTITLYGGNGTYPLTEITPQQINIKQSATSYTSITSSGLDVYIPASNVATKIASFGANILLYNNSGKHMLWANGNGISLYDQSEAERIAINTGGITIKGGTTNQERLVISSTAATFYTGDNKARLTMDSTNGVVMGNTTDNKGRMKIADNEILFYDTNNKKRTTIDASGLTAYDATETDVANFGATARVGKSNSSRFLMNADSLQAYNSSNTKYFEVSASGLKYGTNLGSTAATTAQVETVKNTANTALSGAIEYIVGTHGSTATNVWTGVTRDSALYTGKQIAFYMTSAGTSSAATLNLTLAGGGTTGAKNIRLNNSNVTTHYAQYTVLKLTYDGTYWKCDNYSTGDTVANRYASSVVAGLNGIRRYTLCMKDSAGNWTSIVNQANNVAASGKTCYTGGLQLGKVMYHATGADYAAGANSGEIWESRNTLDFRYSANSIALDSTSTLQLRKFVYLVGTIKTDGLFYLDATNWWTQTPNNTAKTYVFIGAAHSANHTNGGAYQINLSDSNPTFKYDGSKLVEQIITNYMSFDSTNGLKIAQSNPSNATKFVQITPSNGIVIQNDANNYARVNSSGLEVYQGGTSVANFGGAGARVGVEDGTNVLVNNDGLELNAGDESYPYFRVKDLRGADGVYTETIGSPLGVSYDSGVPSLKWTFDISDFEVKLANDGSNDTSNWQASGNILKRRSAITTTTKYFFTLSTTSVDAKSFTFGSRAYYDGDINDVVDGGLSSAFGSYTTAVGFTSFAEGRYTVASGISSHTEGSYTAAHGTNSHAEGYNTIANGQHSHAQNEYTSAMKRSQTVLGTYNKKDTTTTTTHSSGVSEYGTYAVIVGNGTGDSDSYRSNAAALKWDGTLELAKALPITSGGTGLTSSPSMLINLGSTSAANVLQASPRPGITGMLGIANGGTGLTSSPSMLINLGSTSAANVLQASPRPGITGTLGIANGGTGITNFGEVQTQNGSNNAGAVASLSTSGSADILCSKSLGAGDWLVIGYAWFASNATGRRAVKLSTDSKDVNPGIGCMITAPASGTNTELCVMRHFTLTATTTIRLNGYQNSGTSLNVGCYITAIRLG